MHFWQWRNVFFFHFAPYNKANKGFRIAQDPLYVKEFTANNFDIMQLPDIFVSYERFTDWSTRYLQKAITLAYHPLDQIWIQPGLCHTLERSQRQKRILARVSKLERSRHFFHFC